MKIRKNSCMQVETAQFSTIFTRYIDPNWSGTLSKVQTAKAKQVFAHQQRYSHGKSCSQPLDMHTINMALHQPSVPQTALLISKGTLYTTRGLAPRPQAVWTRPCGVSWRWNACQQQFWTLAKQECSEEGKEGNESAMQKLSGCDHDLFFSDIHVVAG